MVLDQYVFPAMDDNGEHAEIPDKLLLRHHIFLLLASHTPNRWDKKRIYFLEIEIFDKN
jgi:hypothetical protein